MKCINTKSIDMQQLEVMAQLALDYRSEELGQCRIIHADCFEWLSRIPENSLHAIVTDPPCYLTPADSQPQMP